jgi:uncharacterized Fe-S cluster-containing MiaB family protein
MVEDERRPDGVVERTATIFLAGAECAFTCSFCDLWRYTIDGPTPRGALPAQIEASLASVESGSVQRIKLYNASNFFDRRAVPREDLPRIAELCAPFSGVTVESHAKTVGAGAWSSRVDCPGASRVAMGLETIHPSASAQLNKRLELERFDRAIEFLADNEIDVRVFVLWARPAFRRMNRWTGRCAASSTRHSRGRDRVDHPGARGERRDGAARVARAVHAAHAP